MGSVKSQVGVVPAMLPAFSGTPYFTHFDTHWTPDAPNLASEHTKLSCSIAPSHGP